MKYFPALYIFGFLGTTASAQLDLVFEDHSTHYDSGDIWITFDNGGGNTPFDVSYSTAGGAKAVTFGSSGSGTNHLSSSIRLSDVTDHAFTINSVSSVAVFVSYGDPFSNLAVSPSFFEGAPSADITYQNFEITRTGGSGDQGNLTNINYFTALMSIRSYSSDYNGCPHGLLGEHHHGQWDGTQCHAERGLVEAEPDGGL